MSPEPSKALPGNSVVSRQLTGPNVWILEARDGHGSTISVTAYLNSYAASDYGELDLSESTMILLQHDPHSYSLIRKIIGRRPSWIKLHDGSDWLPV
jgi:hypothetical protein